MTGTTSAAIRTISGTSEPPPSSHEYDPSPRPAQTVALPGITVEAMAAPAARPPGQNTVPITLSRVLHALKPIERSDHRSSRRQRRSRRAEQDDRYPFLVAARVGRGRRERVLGLDDVFGAPSR